MQVSGLGFRTLCTQALSLGFRPSLVTVVTTLTPEKANHEFKDLGWVIRVYIYYFAWVCAGFGTSKQYKKPNASNRESPEPLHAVCRVLKPLPLLPPADPQTANLNKQP